MHLSRRQFLATSIAVLPALCPSSGSTRPLWPDARYNEADLAQALRRGLRFMYGIASDAGHMAHYADDFLMCFYKFSMCTPDPALKRMAWNLGAERARSWRHTHHRVPEGTDARHVRYYACASLAADGLNFPDERMKRSIRAAARRLSPEDYFYFDLRREPFPADIPQTCANCGFDNPRGRRICAVCGAPLEMMSRYDVFTNAVFTAYVGERYGVPLGASLAEVMHWLPALRPYRGYDGGSNPEFASVSYAVTHVVYALNDYCSYRLDPSWLPDEFAFLKDNLSANIASGNSELMGEFLDTLKSFGLNLDDPLLQAGTELVLSRQNHDGSWGPTDGDVFQRYHPTWTAICGLMEIAWQGERVTSRDALRQAQGG